MGDSRMFGFSFFGKNKDKLGLLEDKQRTYSELVNELDSDRFKVFKSRVENILAKSYLYYDRAETYEDFIKIKAEQGALKRFLGIEKIGKQHLKMIEDRIKEFTEQQKMEGGN